MLYSGQWEDHIKSYWDVRDRPDVLLVKFEDMKENIGGVTARVAKFMNVSLDVNETARIKELVSFDFMKKNAKRIGGAEWSLRITGLPVDPDFKLVNDGKGAAGTFTPNMRVKMDQYWFDKAQPLFGAPTYTDLKMPEVPMRDEL